MHIANTPHQQHNPRALRARLDVLMSASKTAPGENSPRRVASGKTVLCKAAPRLAWRRLAEIYVSDCLEANNRQLHTSEKELIAKKANGNKDVQERLTKAACYVVRCWAEYPENSKEYEENRISVMDAYTLKDELAWVKEQQQNGQFVYSTGQQIVDHLKNDVRGNVLPALGNSVKVVTGTLSTSAGYSICATTAIGCIAGAPMIMFGTSNITEGVTGLHNQYQGIGTNGYNPLKYQFNQMLPGPWGGAMYSGLDLAFSLLAMNARVPLNVGMGDGLGRPTSIFGVTVPKFNNPMLLPITKMPLPPGTGAAAMAGGSVVKSIDFINDINTGINKNER